MRDNHPRPWHIIEIFHFAALDRGYTNAKSNGKYDLSQSQCRGCILSTKSFGQLLIRLGVSRLVDMDGGEELCLSVYFEERFCRPHSTIRFPGNRLGRLTQSNRQEQQNSRNLSHLLLLFRPSYVALLSTFQGLLQNSSAGRVHLILRDSVGSGSAH